MKPYLLGLERMCSIKSIYKLIKLINTLPRPSPTESWTDVTMRLWSGCAQEGVCYLWTVKRSDGTVEECWVLTKENIAGVHEGSYIIYGNRASIPAEDVLKLEKIKQE